MLYVYNIKTYAIAVIDIFIITTYCGMPWVSSAFTSRNPCSVISIHEWEFIISTYDKKKGFIIIRYLIKFNVRIEPLGYGRLIIASLVASLRPTGFILASKARAFGTLQAAVRIPPYLEHLEYNHW